MSPRPRKAGGESRANHVMGRQRAPRQPGRRRARTGGGGGGGARRRERGPGRSPAPARAKEGGGGRPGGDRARTKQNPLFCWQRRGKPGPPPTREAARPGQTRRATVGPGRRMEPRPNSAKHGFCLRGQEPRPPTPARRSAARPRVRARVAGGVGFAPLFWAGGFSQKTWGGTTTPPQWVLCALCSNRKSVGRALKKEIYGGFSVKKLQKTGKMTKKKCLPPPPTYVLVLHLSLTKY